MQLKEVQTKKGKAWEVVGYLGLQPNGKRKKVQKRGFTSRREASAWFNNEVTLFSNGQSQYNEKAPKTVFTVRELYEMWLETYQNTVEESTLNKTLRIFRLYILPDWGNVLVNDITPISLQKYINTLQKKIIYYRKAVGYLRRLLDMAVKLGMIDANPFSKVDMPRQRKQQSSLPKFLDVEEFKKFIEVLDGQYCHVNRQAYTLLRLVAFTGMRTEEVLALQWKHVDFKNNYISIEQALGRGIGGGTYIKVPKSETSRRTLKIDHNMMRALARWYELSNYIKKVDFVFNNQGKPLQILRPNKWLHEVSKRYGVAVGLSMHKLRHTWATLALDRGATVKQVQTYLGHADASITLNIYSDITKRASDDTPEILAGLIE
ncbi:integrase [Fructobacillus pseudoficulneus]|uniref:Integrase n=1 Tax=Fructobacillus pseudoficulneus TaxID=220714 RepID=A0A3F3GSF4_9LACO|nr:site-specific integrase [Fructobacillus pseudoficulneus]GAP02524.1 integrase [Fructobacillus pseudoficulneus]SEH37397.1 Site-specific recombinase XerD [Fructobacillus pseudoficulneus]